MPQQAPNAFAPRYAELRKQLSGKAPEWLAELRHEGWTRFAERGLPSPSLESWKSTNVTTLGQLAFGKAVAPPSTLPALSKLASLELGATRLTFVDGQYAEEHSSLGELPDGVFVGSLRAALEQIPDRLREHLKRGVDGEIEFRALNDALLEDGAVILIPDGVVVEQPLQILNVATGEPTAYYPRTLIVAGERSQAQVVECFTGDTGPYFTNSVCDIDVADGAHLEHVRLQTESDEAFHISTRFSRQGRDSNLRTFSFDFGGKLVRHNVRAQLSGEGGNCDMFGLYLTHGTQHVDNHTTLDHAKPHCDSRELFKGILDDKSRSVFSGRIIVREDAQKTDAKQSNPNLLLSDSALAHTRPQLEIYADDVKCTHGATMGRLDEDALFYLRSRGIGRDDARRMMVEAFAGEVIDPLKNDTLRDALSREVAGRLGRS